MSDTSTTVRARTMTVLINGRPLKTWDACEVVRAIPDISGSFRISYFDEARVGNSFGGKLPEIGAVQENDPVEIRIQDQTVLKGYVDEVDLFAEDHLDAHITGRDVTGDLVDCSVNPCGPAEYRMVTLEQVVSALCAPFGLTVTVQVDTGAPFTCVALDPTEPVMAAIEKLGRQRGVLVTSDGIGGIVLTQAGTTRATDSLTFPGNVRGIEARLTARNRYSDYWVKGQFRSLLRPAQPALNASAAPLSAMPGPAPSAPTWTQTEASAIVRYGHAVDPEVRRYRPRVWLSATQSGGSAAAQGTTNPPLDATAQGLSTDTGPAPAAYHAGHRRARRAATKPRTDASPWTIQDQAAWRMRTMRAQAQFRSYSIPSLMNASGDLWLPNQLVTVTDTYSDVRGDMLIAGVIWMETPDAYRTRLAIAPPDAFDLTGDEDNQHTGRRKAANVKAWDGSAR